MARKDSVTSASDLALDHASHTLILLSEFLAATLHTGPSYLYALYEHCPWTLFSAANSCLFFAGSSVVLAQVF